eukprot:3144142-Prymnesium_polylepis.4
MGPALVRLVEHDGSDAAQGGRLPRLWLSFWTQPVCDLHVQDSLAFAPPRWLRHHDFDRQVVGSSALPLHVHSRLHCSDPFLFRRVRPSSRQDLSALLSTIGLGLVTLYPTLTLSVLMPLHCFDQPDGSNSMVAFPQVTCSSEGTHSAMIGLMVVLILMFPIGILVVCGYLISSYKNRAFSEWATRACKFLFARWRTEAYYYQVPRLLRNFLSGAIISF